MAEPLSTAPTVNHVPVDIDECLRLIERYKESERNSVKSLQHLEDEIKLLEDKVEDRNQMIQGRLENMKEFHRQEQLLLKESDMLKAEAAELSAKIAAASRQINEETEKMEKLDAGYNERTQHLLAHSANFRHVLGLQAKALSGGRVQLIFDAPTEEEGSGVAAPLGILTLTTGSTGEFSVSDVVPDIDNEATVSDDSSSVRPAMNELVDELNASLDITRFLSRVRSNFFAVYNR